MRAKRGNPYLEANQSVNDLKLVIFIALQTSKMNMHITDTDRLTVFFVDWSTCKTSITRNHQQVKHGASGSPA